MCFHRLTLLLPGTSWCGRLGAAGSRKSPNGLQHLRRPTRSAWLVNVLARDSAAMRRLSTLGDELRDAQTGLDSTQLRTLSEQRRRLITDLLEQAQAHADRCRLCG